MRIGSCVGRREGRCLAGGRHTSTATDDTRPSAQGTSHNCSQAENPLRREESDEESPTDAVSASYLDAMIGSVELIVRMVAHAPTDEESARHADARSCPRPTRPVS